MMEAGDQRSFRCLLAVAEVIPSGTTPLMHKLIVNELWRQSKILFPVQILLQVLHNFAELSDSSMQSGPPVI